MLYPQQRKPISGETPLSSQLHQDFDAKAFKRNTSSLGKDDDDASFPSKQSTRKTAHRCQAGPSRPAGHSTNVLGAPRCVSISSYVWNTHVFKRHHASAIAFAVLSASHVHHLPQDPCTICVQQQEWTARPYPSPVRSDRLNPKHNSTRTSSSSPTTVMNQASSPPIKNSPEPTAMLAQAKKPWPGWQTHARTHLPLLNNQGMPSARCRDVRTVHETHTSFGPSPKAANAESHTREREPNYHSTLLPCLLCSNSFTRLMTSVPQIPAKG